MTRYRFERTELAAIAELRRQYLRARPAPLDGMWQAFVDMADSYAIVCGGETVGYCAINGERELLQLHVAGDEEPRELFGQLLAELDIAGAVLATCEAEALALCMDHQRRVAVQGIMYAPAPDRALPAPGLPDDSDFVLIDGSEMATAMELAIAALGANRDWLRSYYGNLIDRQELHGLWQGGALIGIGECRRSELQPPHADLGVIVATEHRGRGLASGILSSMRHHCRNAGLTPICSTDHDNIAAQRAIAKAGFISRHRILRLGFRDA